MKQKYLFKITVEQLDTDTPTALSFQARNHDNILELAQRINASTDKELAFLLGLKLFGESLLEDKDNPLYTNIKPAFQQFMKELKKAKKASPKE